MKSQRRIRLKEVLDLVPLSASTIYKRMGEGTFPRSKDLGGGVVCWRESDILDWLDALPDTDGGPAGPDAENNLGVGEGVSEKKAA
jgi:prophage regulatory protein